MFPLLWCVGNVASLDKNMLPVSVHILFMLQENLNKDYLLEMMSNARINDGIQSIEESAT